MKKLLFIALTVSVLFTACKKDEETTDTRDQFVGSYNSSLNIKVPSLLWDQTYNRVYSFAKSADAGKLIVTDDLGGTMIAKVTGNTFVYETSTTSNTQNGITTTITITGTGSISGNKVTESGDYIIKYSGQTYPGTWSCTHTRK